MQAFEFWMRRQGRYSSRCLETDLPLNGSSAGSMERVLYFRAIYSCGQAVMTDSASALQTVLDAAAALASSGFASMGEVLHE